MLTSDFNKIVFFVLLGIATVGLGENQLPIKHAMFLGFDAVVFPARQNESILIYHETFEEGKPFPKQSTQFADSHSFDVVVDPDDPDSSSNHVGRFELRFTDPPVKRSIRAEVGFRTVQKEAWYAYSVYFPTKDYESDNTPEIISQWHQPNGGSPPNAVQIHNDQIFFRTINRSDARGNNNQLYTGYPLGKVVRGEWQQYIFHFIHSPDSDGLIEIWHNGEKVQTIKGPNMRKDFDLPYFKFGIYKWRWSNGEKTRTDLRVLFFDNVIIGNKSASLDSIIAVGDKH